MEQGKGIDRRLDAALADLRRELSDAAEAEARARRLVERMATLLQASLKSQSIYQKAIPLRPGLYRLDLVLKDVNSGNVGVVNTRLAVPHYDEEKLASSTLILADQISPVSARDIGLGQFVLGDIKVRPKLD